MNESTWRYRLDALKMTEQHLIQRERKCAVREAALVRAVEEGVNARAEKQVLAIVDREVERLPVPFSAVRALDELGSVAAEIDGMRRVLVMEAEDVALERHRLRIWAEQLHAAFASLNARSTELQMEAKRLSGLPQASIQLAQHQQKAVALANAQIENQQQQRQQAMGAPSSRSGSKGQAETAAAPSDFSARDDLLARREAALNERERHVTELFRYVLEQRALAEKQLELIGERIQMLAAAPERMSQQPAAAQSPQPMDPTSFHHPLLGGGGPPPAPMGGGGAAADLGNDGIDYSEP